MLRKLNLIALLAALLLFSNSANAQTTVPLNTGYNHSINGPYGIAPGTQDQYWINIASYPPTTPPVGPAYVIQSTWPTTFPLTNWISARSTYLSAAGVNPENPGYTIFRKCFCLLPGYKEARLSFQIRADDSIQVWLNTQTNIVLAPTWGNHSGPALKAATNKGFHIGKNCVYVLLENYYGGAMGFDLVGDVTAFGLLPTPAAGTAQSFEPCQCKSQGPAGVPANQQRVGAPSVLKAEDDDGQIISEIVKVAEARRAMKQKMRSEGQPSKLEVAPGRVDPIKRPNN